MKIWIDDVRPAPDGYLWLTSVNAAKCYFEQADEFNHNIEIVSMDHDAGVFAYKGGDYIKLLDWFEETGRNYPIHIHSMNPVGVQNMRVIIERNGWEEVK